MVSENKIFFLCVLHCFFSFELETVAGCVNYRLLKSTKVNYRLQKSTKVNYRLQKSTKVNYRLKKSTGDRHLTNVEAKHRREKKSSKA